MCIRNIYQKTPWTFPEDPTILSQFSFIVSFFSHYQQTSRKLEKVEDRNGLQRIGMLKVVSHGGEGLENADKAEQDLQEVTGLGFNSGFQVGQTAQ